MSEFELKRLPKDAPRPEGEEEVLLKAWATPKGWRIISAVNNTISASSMSARPSGSS